MMRKPDDRNNLFIFAVPLLLLLISYADGLFNKGKPLECRTSTSAFDYAGHMNRTKSGKSCQAWIMKSPNNHSFDIENFPDANVQVADDYCRNPNKDPKGPWCYLFERTGKEYCDIPYCTDPKLRKNCRDTRKGLEYRGTVNKTMSGRTCQRWGKQNPHKHIYTDINDFPENQLSDAENYCRNPDGEEDGPWCFTTDHQRGWELCPVPYCHINECKKLYNGTEYSGHIHHTHTGLKCQRWDSQYPHKHDYIRNTLFPDASVMLAENYCRNPDPHLRDSGPWCYTTDPETEWQYCSITLCDGIFGHWTSVFENHRYWKGNYSHNSIWHHFNFTVKGVRFPWEDRRGGVLDGVFQDESSKFDMEGWVDADNNFVFRQTKQYHVKKWFMQGFYVVGHLLYKKKDLSWEYVGIPRTGLDAVNEFKMKPIDHYIIGIGHRPPSTSTGPQNSVGIAVGVSVVVIIIACVIITLIIVMKRKQFGSNKRYLVFTNPISETD